MKREIDDKIIIKIENASFSYTEIDGNGNKVGTIMGVEDISLSIYEGEFLALVGRNGSGKSTLAKMLNGLIVPKTGSVIVCDNGENYDTREDKTIFEVRKRVGMVFQNPDNQMVASIVEDDIAFGPENLGVPRLEIVERVSFALESVGMKDYAQRTPSKLSGGQKQRIAIAGMLALKPRVLVLDESTAMLDPKGRTEVMEVVKKLNEKEKMTVVFITHHMEEVIDADRVIVLDGGKVLLEGTPKEVFEKRETLLEAGLDVPLAAELAHNLRECGLNISGDALTVEELGEELCRLL